MVYFKTPMCGLPESCVECSINPDNCSLPYRTDFVTMMYAECYTGRHQDCPLLEVTGDHLTVECLVSREKWYRKAAAMVRKEIPWENSFTFPDSFVDQDIAALALAWERTAKELNNTIDMLRHYDKVEDRKGC